MSATSSNETQIDRDLDEQAGVALFGALCIGGITAFLFAGLCYFMGAGGGWLGLIFLLVGTLAAFAVTTFLSFIFFMAILVCLGPLMLLGAVGEAISAFSSGKAA
jgi:hypothetical protein